MEREIPVLYKRKEECCGCTACYAICPKEAMHIIQPMPAKESKPPALPGFAHSKIHCIFVNYFVLYFLR